MGPTGPTRTGTPHAEAMAAFPGRPAFVWALLWPPIPPGARASSSEEHLSWSTLQAYCGTDDSHATIAGREPSYVAREPTAEVPLPASTAPAAARRGHVSLNLADSTGNSRHRFDPFGAILIPSRSPH